MSEIKVSGFTFIKNGLSLGYPIKESIESIAPLCDEVIINVGFDNSELNSDDGTYEYLTSYFTDKKFKFLKSMWDPKETSNGTVLSTQTNIALKECKGIVGIYIQGDEAILDSQYEMLRKEIDQFIGEEKYEGLVLNYRHFYGRPDIEWKTKSLYKREVRIIKLDRRVQSWLDAQGFKKEDGSKLVCRQISAYVFHYGHARKENVLAKKKQAFDKLYHGKDFESQKFEYTKVHGLIPYNGEHPKVMNEWMENNQNDIDLMSLKSSFDIRHLRLALSDSIERITGIRPFERKNFILK